MSEATALPTGNKPRPSEKLNLELIYFSETVRLAEPTKIGDTGSDRSFERTDLTSGQARVEAELEIEPLPGHLGPESRNRKWRTSETGLFSDAAAQVRPLHQEGDPGSNPSGSVSFFRKKILMDRFSKHIEVAGIKPATSKILANHARH